MYSPGPKLTLYALVAAAGALAGNPYLDLSQPFPDCAVGAATSAVLSTTCHDETLLCVCTDSYFIDAFTSAASDYCSNIPDVIQAISIIESQCSVAGFLIPTSTAVTGTDWWPPYPTESSLFPSWTGSYHPHRTESCYPYCDVSTYYVSWATTTVPCTSGIEASTTSSVNTPTTQNTAGTTSSEASARATTTLPTTNGAKRRGEKAAGLVGLVVVVLGVVVMI